MRAPARTTSTASSPDCHWNQFPESSSGSCSSALYRMQASFPACLSRESVNWACPHCPLTQSGPGTPETSREPCVVSSNREQRQKECLHSSLLAVLLAVF